MDASTAAVAPPTHHEYKSRPGALIWSFRKSRDAWRRKYHLLKAAEKALKNRVADLTTSREHWRAEARRAGECLAAAEAELAALRARGDAGGKKRTTAAAR